MRDTPDDFGLRGRIELTFSELEGLQTVNSNRLQFEGCPFIDL